MSFSPVKPQRAVGWSSLAGNTLNIQQEPKNYIVGLSISCYVVLQSSVYIG